MSYVKPSIEVKDYKPPKLKIELTNFHLGFREVIQMEMPYDSGAMELYEALVVNIGTMPHRSQTYNLKGVSVNQSGSLSPTKDNFED